MINVVFLWHMHQPYYVNPLTKVAMMPWVRLHAVKGYLDMIEVARKYPEVHMNFNFTPVLIKQLLELARGEVTDHWQELSRKPASDLNELECKQILENFFKIHWGNLIFPFPRYKELLDLRGQNYDLGTIQESVRHFEVQDYIDLQTWYNLSWCGFSAQRRYPELAELKLKGRGFTEEEKNRVLDIHDEIVKLVLQLYREAREDGQVEITTTPFYHPIMPLVYDTNFAHRCMPGRELPPQFSAPDDVAAHLKEAQKQHAEVFGEPAKGLWPSEGSVAPELIPLFKEAGIEYFCTDEDVLFKSLQQDAAWSGREVDHLELFQTWRCEYQGQQINAIFRERPLSDFVGFNAARQPGAESAEYLVHNLEHLETVVKHPNHVVSVVLDGENAWETFNDGGEAFLNQVYHRVQSSDQLCPRRLCDLFQEAHPQHTLTHMHTGSWIGADFDIWIGDAEENRGWEWLGLTRKFLVEESERTDLPQETIERAWKEIYAAEGSDWFWWYGPDFQTDCDFLFDELFRLHLQNVYILLNHEPPQYLKVPIRQRGTLRSYTTPSSFILPDVTTVEEGFYDWLGAGHMDLKNHGGAMYQGDRVGVNFYYGFNEETFFMRLDYRGEPPEQVRLTFHKPEPARITFTKGVGGSYTGQVERSADGVNFYPKKETVEIGAESKGRLKASISTHGLGWQMEGETVAMALHIIENGIDKEVYPSMGLVEFTGPSPKFAMKNWFV
ncbi:MAG: glycoside hydrolase family 57 protein [Verrucomicrobiota bacterium]